jgi:hypothetical protein
VKQFDNSKCMHTGGCSTHATASRERICPINDGLRAGNVMDGGDTTMDDSKLFADDLDDGSEEAIGSAGGMCNNCHFLAQQLVIATQNHIECSNFLDSLDKTNCSAPHFSNKASTISQ